jgi:hypothetical protein
MRRASWIVGGGVLLAATVLQAGRTTCSFSTEGPMAYGLKAGVLPLR